MQAGQPVVLMECKKLDDPLDVDRAAQLARYFHTTTARVAILTNGLVYKFFSDLDAENTMDTTPFMVVDIERVSEQDLENLGGFSKTAFDLEGVRTAAANMKYVNGMKAYLAEAFVNPEDDFVRFLARKVYSGSMWASRVETFTGLTKLAFQGFVHDRVNRLITRAVADDRDSPVSIEAPEPPAKAPDEEEIAGYEAVKAILEEVVDTRRLSMRDTVNYCAIVLDDNRRKTVCRLHFNSANRWYMMVLGQELEPVQCHVDTVDGLANYREQLVAAVNSYLGQKDGEQNGA